MQLYSKIRGQIVSGILPVGSKLPSKRALAEETGLSVITVEHAYSLLADEGYVELKERSGCYVDFIADRKSRKPVPETGTSPDYAQAPAPFAPGIDEGMSSEAATELVHEDLAFSVFAKTIRHVLSDKGDRILQRAPGIGLFELRDAISKYLLRSRGLEISPDRIVIGSGSEYLYGLIIQLTGRGRSVALEKPCYDKILRVYLANGAEYEQLKMEADGISSEALRDCRAGLLHVTPYNSYPSGVTATAAKRYEYAAWAEENGSYIVEDDYDSEFTASGPRIDTIYSIAPERVIYLNTFSRTIASAIRIGYMVLPDRLLEEYREKLYFYSCTVPVLDQYVLAEYINAGDLERNISRRRRRMKKRV